MAGVATVGKEPDRKDHTPVILVVDDEVLIRAVISDYLQECGFKVLEAARADEAIEVLQTELHVDLVFSDVKMPGEIDGFGLAQWVRVNRPEIAVLLTSADHTKAERARELCRSEPFFAKPYDVQRVVAHIRNHIDKRKCG